MSSGEGEIPLPAVIVRERKLIRCNSVTDSIVWMREESVSNFRYAKALKNASEPF